MIAFNKKIIRSVSILVLGLGLLFVLAMAPGKSMAGHQLFGPPDATLGLSEKTTGQVGCVFLWHVSDTDPNSIPLSDPTLKTNFFFEVYIPAWPSHADDLPGINAEGHLLNLPGPLVTSLYKDAISGYAAPLDPDLGGASTTLGPPTTVNFEYLTLFESANGFFITPVDLENMTYDDMGLAASMFKVVPLRESRTDLCTPSESILCLDGGRFKVKITWKDASQNTGAGFTHTGGTDEQGAFWFFDYTRMDVLVKVLDGCEINDHFWVFASATTDVEYTLTVTDTESGAAQQYTNPLGSPAEAITDTHAFATCP